MVSITETAHSLFGLRPFSKAGTLKCSCYNPDVNDGYSEHWASARWSCRACAGEIRKRMVKHTHEKPEVSGPESTIPYDSAPTPGLFQSPFVEVCNSPPIHHVPFVSIFGSQARGTAARPLSCSLIPLQVSPIRWEFRPRNQQGCKS